MWILTVVLMMASGDIALLTFDGGPHKVVCQAMADDSAKLREFGLHIVSATCERVREG